jgi:hypothetical protein
VLTEVAGGFETKLRGGLQQDQGQRRGLSLAATAFGGEGGGRAVVLRDSLRLYNEGLLPGLANWTGGFEALSFQPLATAAIPRCGSRRVSRIRSGPGGNATALPNFAVLY